MENLSFLLPVDLAFCHHVHPSNDISEQILGGFASPNQAMAERSEHSSTLSPSCSPSIHPRPRNTDVSDHLDHEGIMIQAEDSSKLSPSAILQDRKLKDLKMEEVSRVEWSNGRSCLVKVCFHCGATKTPLWRSGPQGPKSLCNACGIRFKKSRKHDAALNSVPNKRRQDAFALLRRRHSSNNWSFLSPKRFQKQKSFDASCTTWNFSSSPSTSSVTFAQGGFGGKAENGGSSISCSEEHGIDMAGVFAKDEEEAALLLMALSSVDGVLEQEAAGFTRRIAERLAAKWDKSYGETMGWVRARLSFAILRATSTCLRRTRVQWSCLGFEDGAGVRISMN